LQGESGLALIASLLVVVLMTAIIVAAIAGAVNSSRTTLSDYLSTRVFYAAEAGAEAALSQIEMALGDGVLTDEEFTAVHPPTLAGFEFPVFRATRDGSVEVETITDGPFTGLYALTQDFTVRSEAEDPSGAHGGVLLGGKAQAIPIFQFGMFFEGGGQIAPGPVWHSWGRVHSNRGLYLAGCSAYFHSPLTTPGKAHRDGWDQHRPVGGDGVFCPIHVYIDDDAAVARELRFDSRDTPDPEQFKARSTADFDARLQTDAFGVDSLKLPLPEGVSPRELIRPRQGDDTETEKDVKIAWKADMYVTVDLATHVNKNAACDNNPPAGAPALLPLITVVRYHGHSAVPSAAEKCRIFAFRWESFYDNYEEGWIDVLDVDIAELRNWIAGPGDSTRIIYVEFQNVDVIPQDAGTTDHHNDGTKFAGHYFPVIKVVNGAQLPGPFSLGSDWPVWVKGNYNTVGWYPSAIYTDFIGYFSNLWQDANGIPYVDEPWETNRCRWQPATICPVADNTTQYLAFISGSAFGHLGCFHEDPGCVNPTQGLIGYGNLMENWRNKTHTLVGSNVTLYAPEFTTPYWDPPCCTWYQAPDRDHRFDTRFQLPENLPPGTPLVGQVLRASFREAY
jgi:hypothetical protein